MARRILGAAAEPAPVDLERATEGLKRVQKDPNAHVEFCCPLCGSREYTDKHAPFASTTAINSGPLQVIGHVCGGCTIPFGDPVRFQEGLSWLTRLGLRQTVFGS